MQIRLEYDADDGLWYVCVPAGEQGVNAWTALRAFEDKELVARFIHYLNGGDNTEYKV